MWKRARLLRFSLTLLALAAACDDDDDPSGPDGSDALTAAEATTLATVVSTGGAVDPETAPVLALLIGEIREHGTITFASPRVVGSGAVAMVLVAGDYDAIAFQALVQFTSGDPEPPSVATGVLGWRGIDTNADTVDEYFLVFAVEDNLSEFPASGSEAVAALDGAQAYYYEDATASSYAGTSGSLTWEGASFGGSSTDCSTTIGPFPITCSYLEGSLAGTLGFEAALVEGSGAATASFAQADYDLPALRFTISDEPPPAMIR